MGLTLTPSILITVLFVCVCVYLWSFTKWHYWKIRGIPYLKPVLPIVGNMYDLLMLKTLPEVANRIYRETKDLPYVGIYAFHTPVLFVRDLDLIAYILIKDFNHFDDRGFHFNKGDVLGRNLIHQSGADWKFSRSKLAPCFNIGSVKYMFPTMVSKSEFFVKQLEKENLANKYIEMWDFTLRYTTDLVTLLTIGVDPNSIENKQDQFHQESAHILRLHFIYHVFTGCFFPNFHKMFRITVAKKRITNFFHTVVSQVINYRRENKYKKRDIVQTMLELQEYTASSVIDKQIPGNSSFIL